MRKIVYRTNRQAGTVDVKIAVMRSWKGVTSKEMEISTTGNGAMCGVEFEVGKTFIVYANKGEGNSMSASLCSRTQMISGKSKDEEYLGKGQKLVRAKTK